jgi:hypothetical protein
MQSIERYEISTPAMPLPPAPSPPVVPSSAPSSSIFWHSIKINISDYPKLRDGIQWCDFDRQIRSTAARHDTIEIIIPNDVTPIHAMTSFQAKQRFMYNVCTNIIHTTKGKNCVREGSKSLDTQKVYASLLEVSHDHLNTTVSSSKLCPDLTLMRLDDKLQKSLESFLHCWNAKIQVLKPN